MLFVLDNIFECISLFLRGIVAKDLNPSFNWLEVLIALFSGVFIDLK